MADEERAAPPRPDEDTPDEALDAGDAAPVGEAPTDEDTVPAGDGTVGEDTALPGDAPTSEDVPDSATGDAPDGAGDTASEVEDSASLDAATASDAARSVEDAAPPSEDHDEPPDEDASALDEESAEAAEPVGESPEEDASGAAAALDILSVDASEGGSSETPPMAEPAVPAGPAPGHLGALRANTPAVGRWLRREARPRPPVQNRYTTEAPEWLQPEFEHQAVEVPSPPLGRSPGRLPAVVLAILMSGVFLLFVLIEPTPMWLLLFGAIMAALGTDGVLRSIRHRIFEREDGPDTIPHIFLPTLFALAIPLFIEENLESYWVIPAALVAGVTFVLVTLAEVPAPEAEDDEFRGRARFVSVAATYFVGFALFSLTYTFDLTLRDALVVVALVSVLLAVELLREGEIDPLETLLLAAVVGVVVAEARWVLKYMPIDAYPAGLTLVLVFYFVTGMVHAYMTRHINITVAAEYSIVTVLGLALVIAARATGIA